MFISSVELVVPVLGDYFWCQEYVSCAEGLFPVLVFGREHTYLFPHSDTPPPFAIFLYRFLLGLKTVLRNIFTWLHFLLSFQKSTYTYTMYISMYICNILFSHKMLYSPSPTGISLPSLCLPLPVTQCWIQYWLGWKLPCLVSLAFLAFRLGALVPSVWFHLWLGSYKNMKSYNSSRRSILKILKLWPTVCTVCVGTVLLCSQSINQK